MIIEGVTIDLECVKVVLFEEAEVKSVEWDDESCDEEGVVLVIDLRRPGWNSITIFLTHETIRELIKSYQRIAGEKH